MVEKYIKDGKVGILYSPGFGAGWSTWGNENLMWDKELIEAFIAGGSDAVVKVAEVKYPDAYLGGAGDLELTWIEQGQAFRINEYDGNESVEYIGPQSYFIA